VLTMPPMLTTLLVLTSPLLAAIPGRGQTRVIAKKQATVGQKQPVASSAKLTESGHPVIRLPAQQLDHWLAHHALGKVEVV